MKTRTFVAVAVSGLGLLCLHWASMSTAQGLHKWVDERGVTHYGDQLPSQMLDKPSQQLDSQGRVRTKTEAAMTPEQRKAIAEKAAKEAEEKTARSEQQRKDKVILAMYANEKDIDAAKARQLDTIQTQMKGTEARNHDLKQRIEALQKNPGAGAAKARTDAEIKGFQAEIERGEGTRSRLQEEAKRVEQRFSDERKRYVEARQAAQGGNALPKPMATKAAGPTVNLEATAAKK